MKFRLFKKIRLFVGYYIHNNKFGPGFKMLTHNKCT